MSYAADVLASERSRVAKRLDEAQDQVRLLRAQLRQLDEALNTLNGASTTPLPVSSRPSRAEGERLIDRIERMLPTDGDGTTPGEIAGRLTEAGRETTGETVSGLLNRLKNERKAEKRGGKTWYRSSNDEGPDDEPGPSLIDPEAPQGPPGSGE